MSPMTYCPKCLRETPTLGGGQCSVCGAFATPEAADTAPASDFDRLPWPEIIELIGGTVQRIQPGEVHFYWHGRDLIAANNGGEYNLMEVTRALDYSLPFGGGRYTGPTDAITLAERLAEALTPAPASPGEAPSADLLLSYLIAKNPSGAWDASIALVESAIGRIRAGRGPGG